MNPIIERVRARCIECGDCWEWQGAVQKDNGNTPVINVDGTVRPVRRVLLEAAGVRLKKRVVTFACGNHLCVNPEHLQAMTRTEFQLRLSQTVRSHSNPVTLANISRAARRNSKLDAQTAESIRQAEGSHREIAKRFGVCAATVGSIKRGRIWRDYTNPFSNVVEGLLK